MPSASVLAAVSTTQVASAAFLGLATLGLVFVYGRVAAFVATRLARWRIQILGSVPLFRLLAWVVAGGIAIFGILQPPRETLLAVAASVGLAVGLAVQDVIKNLLAGILMVFQRPLSVGDMVQVGGHYGEVIGMDLNAVRLRTFEDSVVTVPNSVVLNHAVLNSNSGAVHELVAIPFVLHGDVDVLRVRDLALEAAACSPYVYLRLPIQVAIEDCSERQKATRFTIKAYVLDVRLERAMSTDVFLRISALLGPGEVPGPLAPDGATTALKPRHTRTPGALLG